MTRIEKIKKLCADRGITVKKLEQDLGYSNGSLAKRNGVGIKHNRILEISKYFKVPLGYFYDTDEEYEQAFYEAHTEQIKECRLSSEAQEIARAYMEAPDMAKNIVCDILHVKRALDLSKEA